MNYPIIIYPAEEGGYVAEVPSLKGCLAQGEDIDECIKELETVVNYWLETAKKNNQPIPSASSIIEKIKTLAS